MSMMVVMMMMVGWCGLAEEPVPGQVRSNSSRVRSVGSGQVDEGGKVACCCFGVWEGGRGVKRRGREGNAAEGGRSQLKKEMRSAQIKSVQAQAQAQVQFGPVWLGSLWFSQQKGKQHPFCLPGLLIPTMPCPVPSILPQVGYPNINNKK